MFATALVALLLPAFVAAQYGVPGPTPSPTRVAVPSAPSDTPGNINIDVGFQQTFTFHPNNITAPNGTLVTFWFPDNGPDHSVTQSSFHAPCTYLVASGDSPAGFDSGLQSGKQFTINITDDTIPIWFHCKQIPHCGLGMVGSINAPSTGNTFDDFLANAVNIGSSGAAESDNGPVTGGVGGVATAPPAASTSDTATTGNSSDGVKITYSTRLALLAGFFAVGLSLP